MASFDGDSSWLSQLLQYLQEPGRTRALGLAAVGHALSGNPTPGGPFSGYPPAPLGSISNPALPGSGQVAQPGQYTQTPWGTGVAPNPPRTGGPGVPVGQPYFGPGVPQGQPSFGVPGPAGPTSPMRPAMGGVPMPAAQPPGPGPAPGGQPLLGPGSQAAQLPGGVSPMTALKNSSLLGALLQTIKPQPAGGANDTITGQFPNIGMGGTPVTPTGPLPPASQTFNGNMGGSNNFPIPPTPNAATQPNGLGTIGALGAFPMSPAPPNIPLPRPAPGYATPGIGGKGGPGAGVMPGVPYAAPGMGKGAGTQGPTLINQFLSAMFGSPVIRDHQAQQGYGPMPNGIDNWGNVTY